MKQYIFSTLFFLMQVLMNAQTNKMVHPKATNKTTVTPKIITEQLPQTIFLQLIDSTDKFVVNHATQFEHIDLPKKFYDKFNSYIRDSVAYEATGTKSLVYYNYTLRNGQIINGDIYWNAATSYIVFAIDGKRYVNYFTRDGVQQLKALFKLP